MKIERHLNSITADNLVPISDRSLKRYLSEMRAGTRNGKVKPISREEPFLNIRNSISKAAGVTVLAKLVAMENIHSEDEVGVFLFPRHTKNPIQLVSTKLADEFLRKNNISLSTCEEANQQRAAHIGACLQADTGSLTSFYFRICDSNFPKIQQRGNKECIIPQIFCLNKEKNCYLVTQHTDVTDTTLQEYIAKNATLPAIFKTQKLLIERELAGPTATMLVDSQDKGSQPDPQVELTQGKYSILIT